MVPRRCDTSRHVTDVCVIAIQRLVLPFRRGGVARGVIRGLANLYMFFWEQRRGRVGLDRVSHERQQVLALDDSE